jgi:N-acyl homoserine lactone hydrolase
MSEIKIHILHTGMVRVDKALPFAGEVKSWNPIAYTGIGRSMKHQIWVPVSCYLIEHPKGKVLIDTGWHTAMRGNQRKHLGLLHYLINKGDLPEGKAIHEQLAEMGIQPGDLDYVILSHMHSDHADGLKLVQNAKKIMVSKEEWQGTLDDPKRYIKKEWQGVNLETFEFTETGIGPKKRSFDLFGDGSIVFVHTPGHSVGLAATIIQNNGQFVLLASDVGYATKSWERLIMPGVRVNKKDVMGSLKWVQQQAAFPNCVAAIANHDSNIKPHTITL